MKLFDILNEERNLKLDGLRYDDISNVYTCGGIQLTSLKGCPSLIRAHFECHANLLTSLKGGPDRVFGAFDCRFNSLTSLEGGPSEVTEFYNCSKNEKLKSLKGAPKEIHANFDCSDCDLTSLEGSPTIVKGVFDCSNNRINSFEGMPSEVGVLALSNNKLTSLKDIHKTLKKMDGGFEVKDNPITSHVLGVLLIPGCYLLTISNPKVHKIVNDYLPNHEGMKGVLKCQEELFAADLDDYAQL